MTNIIGQPTFLRVESESDAKVPLPPYLKIKKEVSQAKFYSSFNMAQNDF